MSPDDIVDQTAAALSMYGTGETSVDYDTPTGPRTMVVTDEGEVFYLTVTKMTPADAVTITSAQRCAKCRTPFDDANPRVDGRSADAPYCRACVDNCHDNEITDHRCVICA